MRVKTLLILVVAIVFTISACQKSKADSSNISPHPAQLLTPTPTQISDSPIRKIDFQNFIYPEIEDYETFTLKNGEKPYVHRKEDGIILEEIEFSDLTGDSKEEAILRMSIVTGGSSIPGLIYIYTLRNGKPKFLWGFMTGDRAVGGLKKIYTKNDELIVELFGDSKFVDGKWAFYVPKEKYLGDGRPSIYTINHFNNKSL